MNEREPLIRDISDTARWVAVYRAEESERPDALFHDPFARRLAGERGFEMVRRLPNARRNSWAFVMRTLAIDRLIQAEVARGVDLVVNLAAGMCARPYRLDLPRELTWIEVDLPPLIEAKTAELAGESPRCRLERVGLDLSDLRARRELFASLGRRGRECAIVSEGLLAYLPENAVAELARDLAAVPSFRRWILQLLSPPLLAMLRRGVGKRLDEGGAVLQFAPSNGPAFFAPHGWKPIEVQSSMKLAASLRRLPFVLSLFARLPEPDPPWKRPWSGICRMERA